MKTGYKNNFDQKAEPYHGGMAHCFVPNYTDSFVSLLTKRAKLSS